MYLRLLIILIAFLTFSARAQPIITEDAKLVGSGTDELATAGWAIAAAEGFVVLGAFRDDSAPTTGAAYIFREESDEWEEEVQLSASQQSFFTFGMSVGAWSDGTEDVAIIGARGDGLQPATDAAYIFRQSSGAGWIEEVRLTNGPDIHEAFGSAVAIYDDYAVVGAFGANDFGKTTGATYIFRRTTEGLWTEDARLLASDASAPAGFGRGVDIVVSNDGVPFVLIGAPSDSEQRGAAYAFRRNSDGIWIEEAKLIAPDAATSDLFGRGVAISETSEGEILALAGATGQDIDGMLSVGAGYVFRREGEGSWVFEKKLVAANGSKAQGLGWSVALADAPGVGGTVAVLGADRAYNFAGTVRLFRRTIGEDDPLWAEDAELWATDRAPGDEMGQSVAATSRYAVAGAPNNNGEGRSVGRGAGYVWNLERTVPIEAPIVASTNRAKITVYPNPSASRQVTLQLLLPRPMHIRIDAYDMIGRQAATLIEQQSNSGEHLLPLYVHDWGPGTYFLRLQTENEISTVSLTLLK